jgi:hypothetical protein
VNVPLVARPFLTRTIAGIAAIALVLGGSLVGASAASAEVAPVVSVSPSTNVDTTVANTFTITGTGFTGAGAANGAYVNLGTTSAWTPGTVPSASGFIQSGWVMPQNVVGGAFTTSITVAANTLSPTGSYSISTFAAHGLSITDRSLDTLTPITLKAVVPAANPVVTVTPNAAVDTTVANTFTVSGTGFTGPGAANGAYVNLGTTAAWTPGTVPDASKFLVSGWVQPRTVVNGAFTTTLIAPAGSLDSAGSYGVSTFAAHGLSITDRSLDTLTPISLKPVVPVANPVVTVTPNTDIDPTVATTVTITGSGFVGAGAANGTYVNVGSTAAWTPGTVPDAGKFVVSGWVQPRSIVNGAFSTTLVIPANSLDRSLSYGVATFAAHALSVTDRSLDSFTPITVKALPVPTVTVSKSTLSSAGETITVTGSGFLPNAPATSGTRPPLAGKFTGAYVTFGKFAEVWKPSAGAASSARAADRSTLKWFVNEADVATIGGASAGGAAINPDGTFSVEMLVKPGFTGEPTTGNYGIYTYPGGGAAYAAFETYTPITFVTPTVTVSKSTLSSEGETITVTGSGFAPNAPATTGTRPPLAGKFGGVYVTFGKFADVWKPSAGAAASARKADSTTTKWFVNAEDVATIGGATRGGAAINPDGTFSVEMVVKPGFTGELESGNYGIYTYPGGGAAYPSFETYSPITFTYGPAVSVSKTTGISPLGETVTVTGSGFTPSAPATNGTRPPLAGKFGGAYVTFGKFADVWKPSAGAAASARKADSTTTKWFVNEEDVATIGGATRGGAAINPDGTFSVEMVVKPGFTGELESGNYGIYTYPGGGAVYAPFETFTPISFTAAADTTTTVTADPATITAGASTTLTAQVAPVAAGTVTFRDGDTVVGSAPVDGAGVATVVAADLAVGTHELTAAFAPTSPLAFEASTGTVTVTVNTTTPAPTNGLDWGIKEAFRSYVVGPIAHGTITVDGATSTNGIFGFSPVAGGSYDSPTTSTSPFGGAVTFSGHDGQLDLTFSDPVVTVSSATTATLSLSVNDAPSASFATLDLSKATVTSTDGSTRYTGAPAVLTAAGSTSFAGFYTAGTVLDPVSFTVDTTVAPTNPDAPVATSTTVVAAPSTVTAGATTTVTAQVAPVTAGTVTFRLGGSVIGTVDASAAGSASVTTPALTAGEQLVTAEFAPSDTTRFVGSTGSVVVTVTVPQVTPPVAGPPAVGAGSLTWGVKQSFRDYVTGPIAKGAISTSGVSTSGGAFVFSQASGGTYDRATGTGTSAYSGSVHFTGHAGILDVTLSNPVVRIDSATSGTLLVTAGGSQIPFASLNLAAGSLSTPNNTVSYAGVPASLTSQGVAVFALNGSGFYPAGTTLDPVSFVIGAPSAGSSAGPATVASFASAANTPAPTVPATTGLTITPGTSLTEGDEITVTAGGFQPNEKNILAVVYSDPIVLSSKVEADASGIASWTGRLPAGLTGTHTVTLQGSVDRGVEVTIAAKAATAVTGCVVDDASLTWGFKESFRSYISGSIANGEWTVADGATYTVPDFGFSNGTGGYDPETAEGLLAFAGSIAFTGHGGLLNTTVSNPQLRLIDETSAIVLLDIAGTTQEGAAIDSKAVEFGSVDLTGAVTTDDGVVTITAAPAVLTAAGAEAFGTYPEGEELDPITASFSTEADCAIEAEDAETPVTTTSDDEAETAVVASDSTDLGWILWVVLALVVLAAAVAIVLVVRRRAATRA